METEEREPAQDDIEDDSPVENTQEKSYPSEEVECEESHDLGEVFIEECDETCLV